MYGATATYMIETGLPLATLMGYFGRASSFSSLAYVLGIRRSSKKLDRTRFIIILLNSIDYMEAGSR